MKFTLMSDLHLDFPQDSIPYEKLEDVVVVAGDSTNGLEGLRFLERLKWRGMTPSYGDRKVFACDGNHEHYANISQRRDVEETTARFRELFPSEGEVDEIKLVLTNGWYNVSSEGVWQTWMNDSNRCSLSASEVNTRAVKAAEKVRSALEEWKALNYRGIVVTHTAPCTETLNPEFEGHFSNEWYWNPSMRPLLSEFREQILVWCHGHTHAFQDKEVEGVRVVCNPRGYPGENPDWKPYTVELN